MIKYLIKYNVSNPHEEGYLLLRELLKKDYTLTYNSNGKPFIKDSDLFFNISHTEDTVICVVSDREVGVDIEKIKDYDHSLLDLFNYPLLSNKEFFKEYTKKEAILKKQGLSLKEIMNVNEDCQIKYYYKKGYVICIAF